MTTPNLNNQQYFHSPEAKRLCNDGQWRTFKEIDQLVEVANGEFMPQPIRAGRAQVDTVSQTWEQTIKSKKKATEQAKIIEDYQELILNSVVAQFAYHKAYNKQKTPEERAKLVAIALHNQVQNLLTELATLFLSQNYEMKEMGS